MAPPCSPSTQRSDFIKITIICFVCIAIIHQWSLAEIATSAVNKTAPTPPDTKQAAGKKVNPGLVSVIKKAANTKLVSKQQGKDSKHLSNSQSDTIPVRKIPSANMTLVDKKVLHASNASALTPAGKKPTNKTLGLNQTANHIDPDIKPANNRTVRDTDLVRPKKTEASNVGKGNMNSETRLATQWTESTDVPVTKREFVASENDRVFILGVVAKNSTPSVKWDKFAVYGQWYDHKSVNESTIRCCFKYSDGAIIEHPYAEFDVRNYKPGMLWAKLMLFHITCNRPRFAPLWVSIARYQSCNSADVSYIKPYYAMKKADGHIVITTKMAYRYINPETIVGFLETARYLGVGKVVTYVMDSLEPDLKKIMRYYAHIGILDYYTIELAQSELVFRRFPPVVNAQYRSDEWVIKRDAMERNIGSSFFGIFDMDEYLIPSSDRSLPQLLSDLLVSFPNASHFFFKNVHFFTEYNFRDPFCAPNCSMFRRNIMTSPQRFNSIHEKMFMVTSRVVSSTVTNHRIQSMSGYVRITCPESEAYIRHYGKCFRKFTKPICGNSSLWLKDVSMVTWSERTISDNVELARKVLKVF